MYYLIIHKYTVLFFSLLLPVCICFDVYLGFRALLSSCGDSTQHPCFALDLSGIASRVPHLSKMLALELGMFAYHIKEIPVHFYFFEFF